MSADEPESKARSMAKDAREDALASIREAESFIRSVDTELSLARPEVASVSVPMAIDLKEPLAKAFHSAVTSKLSWIRAVVAVVLTTAFFALLYLKGVLLTSNMIIEVALAVVMGLAARVLVELRFGDVSVGVTVEVAVSSPSPVPMKRPARRKHGPGKSTVQDVS